MRNTAVVLCLVLVVAFIFSACGNKPDAEKDIEAIKSVINSETQAWIDKNPDKMKEYYIHDEFQTRVNIQDSIFTIATGWEKRSVAIDTLTKYVDWVGVDAFKVEKEFLAVKVYDDAAWAVLKETQNMIYNGSPVTSVAIINVMLEKIDKNWKISCFVKSNI